MRAGKLLLTAGFLFGLTVAASGAEVSDPATAKVSIKIVEPLTLTVASIDFGVYGTGTDLLSLKEETATISITGAAGETVDLELTSLNDGLKKVDGTDTLATTYSIDQTESIAMTGSPVIKTLKVNITETSTDYTTGTYEDTVTVTAAYN